MWPALLILTAGLYEDGLKLLTAGRWPEARLVLAKAVEAEPRNALAWKALGVAAGQSGDVVEAEEAFRRGCEIEPRLEDICYFHARSLYTLNRFVSAIEVLEGLRGKEPRPGRLLTALGQAYEANGQAVKAEAAFQQGLGQRDHRSEALLRYGIYLFRAGRMEEAETRVREALAQTPSYVEAEAELGRILYQRGEIRLAIPMLEQGSTKFEWAAQLLEKAKRREAILSQP